MSTASESYRRILFATAVMGGATIVSIIVGIVRTKIFALTIGPAGIGLVGLLTSIMTTAAALGGMGLGFSGVREIAAADERRARVRRALWLAVWPLAIATALILWFARVEIARLVAGSLEHALAVGLMGPAAALTIVAGAQVSVIQGVGNVGGVARARVWGAVLSLVIGVPAVLYLGPIGLALAVLAIPVGNMLAALPYRPPSERSARGEMRLGSEVWRLVTLGAAFMLVSALSSAVLVVVRTLLIRQDGLDSAGLYQAAYAISALNASLVLSAMATDYFPRLSGSHADRAASSALVNQQLHAALLLASPVLLTMAALAPLVLDLLYSAAFAGAADLLRWQLTGEVLKLPGWALSFLLLARADKGRYLVVESMFAVAYVGLAVLLLEPFGLRGVGIAYAAAYLLYSLLLLWVCARWHSASLGRANLLHLALVGAALLALALLGPSAPWIAAGAGLVAAAAAAAYALRHLNEIRRSRIPAPEPE
jgi:PST family polysaccharide transporter